MDPSTGLCVGTGEQFVLQNSHYQHSAAGLQLAGAERSVAQQNKRLIFPPFLLKCRYDQLLSAKTTTKNFLQLPVHFSNFSFFFFTENSPTNLTITAKYAVNMLNNILVVVVFDTFQIYFL